LKDGFQLVIVGKYQCNQGLFITPVISVFVGRPHHSLPGPLSNLSFRSPFQLEDNILDLGETLTNSIYNAAPIIWQVSRNNLGRCPIRQIPMPRHYPPHPDQYISIVLPLWTGS
jgi:hypothetical protein